MTRSFEAWGPHGLVRTFNTRQGAEEFRNWMAGFGTQITIKLARLRREVAA